jgi:hypothetical protein
MQRVDGIQTVRVSLKDGLTILDLKPDNGVTVSKLRMIIKNNGFVSKEAVIVAAGHPEGTATFVVSGTNESLTLSTAPQQAEGAWRLSVAAPKP